MFGSDDQNQNPAGQATAAADPAMPVTDADAPAGGLSSAADVVSSAPSAPTIPDPMVTPSAQPDLSTEASAKVEAGINSIATQNAYAEPAPQIGSIKPSEPENVPTAAPVTIGAPDPATVDPDLAQIKLQALQSLEPLVGQLDQAPNEKFKTIMMLIQASDNSKMLKEAYEAASQITDEKARAQALLDIVNEINYFIQQAASK